MPYTLVESEASAPGNAGVSSAPPDIQDPVVDHAAKLTEGIQDSGANNAA